MTHREPMKPEDRAEIIAILTFGAMFIALVALGFYAIASS